MAVDGKEGSEKAGGGTEGSMLVSGTFASRSEDRWSSEAEVDGAWDSFWLEITIGGSKGENCVISQVVLGYNLNEYKTNGPLRT